MQRLWVLPVALLLSACNSIPSGWTWVPTTTAATPRVAVVGDSLTWQAEHGSTSTTDPYYERHYLTDLLNKHGMATRVAAKSGVTTDSLRLWTRWETAPDVIVMALGTNDNYFDVPITTSINNVRTYLARWPDGCTVYVGVVPSTPRRIDDTAPAWNDWLRQEAGRTGGVYLDWPAISAGHRDWFVSDLLHHTAAGQAAYRQAILDGVEECL